MLTFSAPLNDQAFIDLEKLRVGLDKITDATKRWNELSETFRYGLGLGSIPEGFLDDRRGELLHILEAHRIAAEKQKEQVAA